MARTIFVTGAASGIGLACTRNLLRQGDRVAAIDLNADSLASALGPDTENLLALPCDVSNPAAVEQAVARSEFQLGPLDSVIHCAALHSPSFWMDLEADEFNRVLQVNVTGSFLVAKAAAKAMRARGGGAIVLTSSANVLAGGIGGQAGMGGPAYVASKAAIVGLVRSLARSLGPDGIRVNAVMPGVTLSHFSGASQALGSGSGAVARRGTPGAAAALLPPVIVSVPASTPGTADGAATVFRRIS